jgi:signal peptidase I
MNNVAKPPASVPSTTEERLKQKKQQVDQEPTLTMGQRFRGYADALVFAFILAMFIRTFVFELFMIPTGSMTPTLIGDSAGEVAFMDYDGDGVDDIIYTFPLYYKRYKEVLLQICLLNEDGSFRDQLFVDQVDFEVMTALLKASPHRKDMILVNKFSYWFSPPDRGDIAVFKVPYRPNRQQRWEVDKPVYIKRVVGLPGETVTFQPNDVKLLAANDPNRIGTRFGGREIHLYDKPVVINGKELTDGSLGNTIHFSKQKSRGRRGDLYPSRDSGVDVEEVDDQSVLMIGDNAYSSSDGRYWGAVPLNHLRGRAVLRYIPIPTFGLLDKNRYNPPRPNQQFTEQNN